MKEFSIIRNEKNLDFWSIKCLMRFDSQWLFLISEENPDPEFCNKIISPSQAFSKISCKSWATVFAFLAKNAKRAPSAVQNVFLWHFQSPHSISLSKKWRYSSVVWAIVVLPTSATADNVSMAPSSEVSLKNKLMATWIPNMLVRQYQVTIEQILEQLVFLLGTRTMIVQTWKRCHRPPLRQCHWLLKYREKRRGTRARRRYDINQNMNSFFFPKIWVQFLYRASTNDEFYHNSSANIAQEQNCLGRHFSFRTLSSTFSGCSPEKDSWIHNHFNNSIFRG